MAKPKIPKKIGGVKVPKKVRRQAKKAIKLVESPVREFAISGLTAAAEALAQRTASELRAAGQTQRRASLAALDLGDMLREAAIEGARRFLSGFEEAQRAASPARAAPAARKRKAAAKPATKKAPAKPAARPKPQAKPKAAAKPASRPAKKPAAKTPAAKTPAGKPRAARPAAAKRRPTGRSGGGRAAPA